MGGVAALRRNDVQPQSSAPMSLEEASESYAKLKAKRNELAGSRLGQLQKELDEALKALKAYSSSAAMDSRVAAILADVDENAAKATELSKSGLQARVDNLRREINDVHRAIKMLDERIDRERTAASVVVCNAIRPEYARRVGAVCEALLQVHRAQAELQELVEDLERHDVAWGMLQPMQPTFLSSPTDNHGRVANYLREAAGHGYFDMTNIPQRLR